MDLQKAHKKEMANLINVADNSSRILLHGSIIEKKQQLLTRLKAIDDQYTSYLSTL